MKAGYLVLAVILIIIAVTCMKSMKSGSGRFMKRRRLSQISPWQSCDQLENAFPGDLTCDQVAFLYNSCMMAPNISCPASNAAAQSADELCPQQFNIQLTDCDLE